MARNRRAKIRKRQEPRDMCLASEATFSTTGPEKYSVLLSRGGAKEVKSRPTTRRGA